MGDTHARVAPPHPTSPRLASYVIIVSAGREWFARFRSLAQDVSLQALQCSCGVNTEVPAHLPLRPCRYHERGVRCTSMYSFFCGRDNSRCALATWLGRCLLLYPQGSSVVLSQQRRGSRPRSVAPSRTVRPSDPLRGREAWGMFGARQAVTYS